MEQRVLNTRTVKTVGEGGLEGFTTVVLDSLHYESHLICTNCGPLGLKADVEPSTNRAALSDRSWAHIVHSNDDHESGDVDFDPQKCSDDLKQQINRYQVCACLVAYLLIFIKHIPSCRPNLTFANVLCNKWYEILWNEYNLPRPSKRKKLKLRMMLELFAIESAVFEKFVLPESAVDFADMRPDATGQLSSFCIEQLADVVRSGQRTMSQTARTWQPARCERAGVGNDRRWCPTSATSTPSLKSRAKFFLGRESATVSTQPSHWRDCHFADALSPSLLKHLLKVEGGAAE